MKKVVLIALIASLVVPIIGCNSDPTPPPGGFVSKGKNPSSKGGATNNKDGGITQVPQ